jgi:hypothetical protein
MYGDYRNKTKEETSGVLTIDELEEDDYSEERNDEIEVEKNETQHDSDGSDVTDDDDDDDVDRNDPRTKISGLKRSLNNLNTFYNHTTEQANIFCAMIAYIHDGNPDPKNFYEVESSKDWAKWWQAMSAEFKNMEDKNFWTIINKSDLPSGRKLISNRRVYAVKDNVRFQARTAAQGFSQVPGKDFYETMPLLLIMQYFIWQWHLKCF